MKSSSETFKHFLRYGLCLAQDKEGEVGGPAVWVVGGSPSVLLHRRGVAIELDASGLARVPWGVGVVPDTFEPLLWVEADGNVEFSDRAHDWLVGGLLVFLGDTCAIARDGAWADSEFAGRIHRAHAHSKVELQFFTGLRIESFYHVSLHENEYGTRWEKHERFPAQLSLNDWS